MIAFRKGRLLIKLTFWPSMTLWYVIYPGTEYSVLIFMLELTFNYSRLQESLWLRWIIDTMDNCSEKCNLIFPMATVLEEINSRNVKLFWMLFISQWHFIIAIGCKITKWLKEISNSVLYYVCKYLTIICHRYNKVSFYERVILKFLES